MHAIRIGCCGWSYEDWLEVFYPIGTPAGDYLRFYADRFEIVEVDSTFYRSPSPRMVQGWHDKTPDSFLFCLKVPQSITHEKVLLDCDRERDMFLNAVRILGPKLHSVCLQFGYFNRQKFASVDRFLERLDPFLANWPQDVAVAVEVRNKNWIGQPYLDVLRRHHAAQVLVQQSWMPSLTQMLERGDAVTGPFSYVRLLGDRDGIEKITTTWNKTVIDRTEEIQRVAEALRTLAQTAPVLVFVNNHYAGFGPDTAETVSRFLADT